MLTGQELTGKKATEMWYNEIKHYSYKNARHTPNTGHFTQVTIPGFPSYAKDTGTQTAITLPPEIKYSYPSKSINIR